ncbi:MAG: TonB-dependent receptor [Thermoanaerobaculia bacterium]|nr:TonB-dependent receptor [Thermoanaerobaculia bacterium]
MKAALGWVLWATIGFPILVEASQEDHEKAPAPDAPVATVYEEVYATAVVEERPTSEATASVTVVGEDEVERRGATTVSDLLPFVPGVSLVSGGTRGGLTVAQIRGGDPNFTRVLIDHVAVNDGSYQVGGVFDLEALPADAVERIEVVRGPLSSFYGSGGLAGAIHVITRQAEGSPRGTVRLTAGDAGLRRGSANLGAAGDRISGFASAVVEEESERIAEECFELGHLQTRSRIELGQSRELSASGRFAQWSADDYPDASGGPVFGSGELRRSDHDEASLGLRFSGLTSRGASYVAMASVYRHHLDRESPGIFPVVPQSAEETRFVRGRVGWMSAFEGRSGQLTLGVDAEWEDGDNRSLLRLPPFLGGDVPGDYDLQRTTAGVMGEWTARGDGWAFDLGLRVDLPEDTGEELSPRIGVTWRLNDEIRLRMSLGSAFKLPSFFALASPSALGGNPELEAEEMLGGDLGIEGSLGTKLDFALTAFSHRYENLVDFDFDTFRHVNRSAVDSFGAESFIAWTSGRAWRVAANATWQDVEDRDSGLPLRNRPRWSGGLRVDWRPIDRVRLGIDLRSSSERHDEQIPVPQRDTVDGFHLVGLAATTQLGANWHLGVRVDNLADRDYEHLIGFPGAGRSVRWSLTWDIGR